MGPILQETLSELVGISSEYVCLALAKGHLGEYG